MDTEGLPDAASAIDSARAVRNGYDGSGANPLDARLRVRFFNEPQPNEDMSKRGYDIADGKKVRCTCGSDIADNDPRATQKRLDAVRLATEAGIHVPTGRAIYEDILMVEIINPSDNTCRVVKPAIIDDLHPGAHHRRFPRQYEHYLKTKDGSEARIGTPLMEMSKGGSPALRPSEVKEFEALGCRTIEDLANMSDAGLQRFMGGQSARRAAQQYLEVSRANAPMEFAKAELAARDAEIATMREQIRQLGDRLQSKGKDSTVPDVAPPPKRGRKPKAEAPA